jgi:hypothetical protein
VGCPEGGSDLQPPEDPGFPSEKTGGFEGNGAMGPWAGSMVYTNEAEAEVRVFVLVLVVMNKRWKAKPIGHAGCFADGVRNGGP